MTEERLRQLIREELQAMLMGTRQSIPKTPAQIALAMVRNGQVEESKLFLKGLTARKRNAV